MRFKENKFIKTLYLQTPITKEKLRGLSKGDIVYLSGTIFTARDAAHKKMLEHLQSSEEALLRGEVIYHAGPCPKGRGIIGSIGPTTSYRMDAYAQVFAEKGIKYSIGKGKRSIEAEGAIISNGGVHFDAIGGGGALYMQKVKKAEIYLFAELGTEAIWRLEVVDFPLVVSII